MVGSFAMRLAVLKGSWNDVIMAYAGQLSRWGGVLMQTSVQQEVEIDEQHI
jgi:hypothetical protein